jgi:putative ABC transport system substrate-binding protein
MVNVSDPVAMGLVKSLARPGGNLTGISNVTNELSAKHLEMIHSMVPKVSAYCRSIESIQLGARRVRQKCPGIGAKDGR